MILLSKEQILMLHKTLIERYGGIEGIRDEGLLDSAINAPFQAYGDYEFYPTVPEKAARLGYGLIRNHPFLDGNKRIGVLAMLTFLSLNHISLRTNNPELTEISLHVADASVDDKDLLSWILSHME